MNCRQLCLLFVGLLSILSLPAQVDKDCDVTLTGRVFDLNTKEPLAFVNVLLEGTTIGTTSDVDGQFKIEQLCEKEFDLRFSFIGYKTATHHHDFHHPSIAIFLAPEDYNLESIVVEAEGIQSDLRSLNTTKLSGEALDAIGSESFGEVVSNIAGVHMSQMGQNISKPIIHGLHSNRILVINNGLRHAFQNWGIDHAPEIDPSLLDNVEVVKGAATVRFGSDAMGGAILVNPPKMELATDWEGKLALTGKSNGQSMEGTAEIHKGFKRWSIMGGTSYVKQGDLSAPNYLLTNTGKEELSYHGGLKFHLLPELDIEAYYSNFDQTLGILSGSVFGNLDDIQRALDADIPLYTDTFRYDIGEPRQEVQHSIFKASINYIGKKQSLKLHYGRQRNLRQEFGVRRVDAPNIDLELQTESLDLEWRHPSIGVLSGKFGIHLLKQANDNIEGTQTVPFIPNYDERRAGVYWIESLDLGKNTIEWGARFDYFDSKITGREPDNTIYRNFILYRNISGTLGWNHNFDGNHSFRTNIGTAWRPPNVAELYRFGQHTFFLEYGLWRYEIDERFDFVTTSGGILTQEDKPIPSEIAYKWINTYTITKPNFTTEITAYINYIENYIYNKPGGFTRTARGYFTFFIYDQTDALFWGIDWTSEWKHSKLFQSTIQGSYLWSKQISENDFFVGQPPAQIRYDLTFVPDWKFTDQQRFNVSLNYTFRQFQAPRILTVEEFLYAANEGINRFTEDASDFDIIPPPPGFFLVDFAWNGRIKKFGWQFQVRNLLNTSYRSYTNRMRYFADELGRNFVLTLNYEI